MNRFRTALAIQDACNMRGIAREFVKVVDEAAEETQSTSATWHDPAVVMMACKIADLAGLAFTWPVAAQSACEERDANFQHNQEGAKIGTYDAHLENHRGPFIPLKGR